MKILRFIIVFTTIIAFKEDYVPRVMKNFLDKEIKIMFTSYSHYHLAENKDHDENYRFMGVNKFIDAKVHMFDDRAIIAPNGDDSYEIKLGSSYLCAKGKRDHEIYKCGKNEDNTRWEIVPQPFGFQIGVNDRCITKENEEKIVLRVCSGSEAQTFDFKRSIGIDKCDEKNQKKKELKTEEKKNAENAQNKEAVTTTAKPAESIQGIQQGKDLMAKTEPLLNPSATSNQSQMQLQPQSQSQVAPRNYSIPKPETVISQSDLQKTPSEVKNTEPIKRTQVDYAVQQPSIIAPDEIKQKNTCEHGIISNKIENPAISKPAVINDINAVQHKEGVSNVVRLDQKVGNTPNIIVGDQKKINTVNSTIGGQKEMDTSDLSGLDQKKTSFSRVSETEQLKSDAREIKSSTAQSANSLQAPSLEKAKSSSLQFFEPGNYKDLKKSLNNLDATTPEAEKNVPQHHINLEESQASLPIKEKTDNNHTEIRNVYGLKLGI